MGKKYALLSALFLLAALPLAAQLVNGQDTLYGNEWINYDQPYHKIAVAEDGVYRVPYATLQAAGIPVTAIDGARYQLWWMGEEQPLHVSTTGPLGPGDYLEFYGRQNRSELDRYLFANPDEEMLNPYYSLFTDTSAYYLTWVAPGAPALRYETVANDLTDLPPKEEWFWGEERRVYSSTFQKKYVKSGNEDIYRSIFDGDGFGTNMNHTHNLEIPTPSVYAQGPPARLELRTISNFSVEGHTLQVTLNGNEVLDTTFNGVNLRRDNFDLPAASLTSSLSINVSGLNGNNDRYSIGAATLRYPRTFALAGTTQLDLLLPQSAGSRYLEITGAPAGTPLLLEPGNRRRLVAAVNGNTVQAKLPAAAGDRRLIFCLESAVREVGTLEAVVFQDFRQLEAEFLILTSELLRSGNAADDPVQAYADYRSGSAGGGFTTGIVNVEDLYEQFAYGIARHPLSVSNFAHFLRKHGAGPQYFFIIGKGRTIPDLRTSAQLAAARGINFFVPTFGYPASDNLLLAGARGRTPLFPVGRLAATTAAEIDIYLRKVRELEDQVNKPQDIANRAWRKQIIHLGGGISSFEQDLIRNYLTDLGDVLESNLFGGRVSSFYKTSTDPLSQPLNNQIFERINEGSSIITFFGHASPGTFDFNIDNPDNYLNAGRTPLMISLSCYSGNLFTSSKSISERFLFFEDKGAIAFGASLGLGFISPLYQFARNYYQQIGGNYYGQGIGDGLRQTLVNFAGNSNLGFQILVEQFTLHGDPAVRLNAAPGPDFVIDGSSVKFSPPVVNAQLDSFTVAFDIYNLGTNDQDSLTFQVSRRLPGGQTVEHIAGRKITAPGFRKTVEIRLPVIGEEAIGENTLLVKLDPENAIPELPSPAAEQNNDLISPSGQEGFRFFILDNTTRPVYPPDFALVGGAPVTLKVSTSDALAPARNYLLEIDTTRRFNSPVRQRTTLNQSGGVIKWTPQLNWQDSTVYYWRVSPDSISAEIGYVWEERSFTYIEGSPDGWGQSHYYQFRDNRFANLQWPEESRTLNYLSDFKDIRIIQGQYRGESIDDPRPEITVNNEPYRYIPWDNPTRGGVMITVLDSVDLNPWINQIGPGTDNGQYESDLPYWLVEQGYEYGIFPYRSRTLEDRRKIIRFLDSIVPPNNYVILITTQDNGSDYEPEEWAEDSLFNNGRNLFNLLEEQGAQLIRSTATAGAVPYYFIYKKDAPNAFREEGFTSLDGFTVLDFSIPGFWDSGTLTSRPVGPARAWGSLHLRVDDYDLESDDLSFDVIGIRSDQSEALLLTDLSPTDTSLSAIDAGLYPYLKLRLHSADTTFRTPPQLDHWRVLYEGIPELAVNPAAHYLFVADTIQQGATLQLEMGLENISKYDMDSLLVCYTLTDAANNQQEYRNTLPAVPAGDLLTARFEVPTHEMNGRWRLMLEANPEKDQPELFHPNNFAFLDFLVQAEQYNPLLDVTFDGVRIMDGDIVSAEPLIHISLDDENPYLALSDTSLIDVYLRYPGEATPQRLSFSSDYMDFYPANPQNLGQKNRAKVELRAQFTVDGRYELTVQAEDASGNSSGLHAYKVNFEVFSKPMISNVLNYPNPFSTSTRFVYTLTGAQPPDQYLIQIMTVSGRVVRELDQYDLGPLRIGTHRTEFSWDGTDEYGDRLANGVYLYRVVVKGENGKTLDHFENQADRFFQNGIGKLVILR